MLCKIWRGGAYVLLCVCARLFLNKVHFIGLCSACVSVRILSQFWHCLVVITRAIHRLLRLVFE